MVVRWKDILTVLVSIGVERFLGLNREILLARNIGRFQALRLSEANTPEDLLFSIILRGWVDAGMFMGPKIWSAEAGSIAKSSAGSQSTSIIYKNIFRTKKGKLLALSLVYKSRRRFFFTSLLLRILALTSFLLGGFEMIFLSSHTSKKNNWLDTIVHIIY